MASKSDTKETAGRPFLYYHEENGQKAFGWLTAKGAALRSAASRARVCEEKTEKRDYACPSRGRKKRRRPTT